jgi:hypothetical protein
MRKLGKRELKRLCGHFRVAVTTCCLPSLPPENFASFLPPQQEGGNKEKSMMIERREKKKGAFVFLRFVPWGRRFVSSYASPHYITCVSCSCFDLHNHYFTINN